MVLSRSNSFFNFRPLEGFGQINLPQVGVDPDPTDNRAAPYQFSVTEVGPDAVTFIDPPVAVGYDYAIGAGDPNFASVIFPEVGDDVFALIFGDTEVSVLAGEQFFFPLGGVAAFGVRGIEPSAGLDPNDVLAFVTGLTFVGEGSFTGTMTPIIVDVTTPVLEPSLLVLLGTATAPLVGLGWWTTRRRR